MIIEFDDEESYLAAQQILIKMHEENPPPPSPYRLVHFVRDDEAEEAIRRMAAAGIAHVTTKP